MSIERKLARATRRGKRAARQLHGIADALLLRLDRIVEVGVYNGAGARKLRKHFPQAELVLVDMWRSNGSSGPMHKRNDDDSWEDMYLSLCYEFMLCDRNAIVIRSRSDAAVRAIEPGTVSACYIDAGHKYDEVLADIKAWLPMMCPYGILGGHDYVGHNNGVRQAVHEVIGENNILTGSHRTWWTVIGLDGNPVHPGQVEMYEWQTNTERYGAILNASRVDTISRYIA